MIIIHTIEEEFAKWLGDGEVELIEATKTISEDKLTTTVVSKSAEQLVSEGFQKFETITVGKPGAGKKPVVTWELRENVLYKVTTWTSINNKD